jgi:prepilin-type N-terminal cleavage/methylation domain-containing protein
MNTFRLPKSRNQSGFTILELVAVIVIIGILLVLIIITHSGVQRSERDTERQRDIKALHLELTAYYTLTNHYPTLSEVNDSNWRSANMKGLDDDVLQDPLSIYAKLADKPDKDVYAYKVTATKGTSCDNQKTPCTQYTLTATLEGSGTFVKNNLN